MFRNATMTFARDLQMQLALWAMPGASPMEFTPEAAGCLRAVISPRSGSASDCPFRPRALLMMAASVVGRALVWHELDGSPSTAVSRQLSAALAVVIHALAALSGRLAV